MLDISLWLWLMAAAVGLAASTITTITGIGAGLITYGVLSFFLDLKVIIPLFAPAQLLAVSMRLWVFRTHVQWRLAGYFFLGVLPGIYGGTLLFHMLSETALRRLLGLFLLGFAIYEFWQRKAARGVPHTAILPLGGVAAGLLLGSIGVAGPLLAVVFLRYGLFKEDLVAMIALFFLVGNTQRVLLYWQQGALEAERLMLSLVLGTAMLCGVYFGRLLLPRVSHDLFVRLLLGMLLLFGSYFLLS